MHRSTPERRAPLTPLAWFAARPTLTAFLLYLVLAVLFFLPGLIPGHTTSGSDYLWSAAPWNTAIPSGVPLRSSHPLIYGSNPVLVDPSTVFEPFLQYTRSQLPHVPLWDPYIMGGMPYLGDMQSAIFSPFSLPAYVLPFWWSLSVIAVLKVLVAAMGAYLLGRTLNMRFAAAFVCGAVFGFGLFLVAWLAWPLANVFPFIPWLLFATDRLVRKPDSLTGAGLALIVALQFFGGHPESSFDAMFVTVAFFVMRVLQAPGNGVAAITDAGRRGTSRLAALTKTVRRPVIVFVLALALGAALAAIIILPFLELLHQSSDLTARPRGAVYVSPKYFFSIFFPNYFPAVFKDLTGFYVGALSLMLAVIAMFRANAQRIAVAVLSVICVLVVLGIQPFFGIVSRLPGFSDTYNSRLTILFLMGVALLAGWGLQDIMRSRPSGRYARAIGATSLAIFVFPIIVALATGSLSFRYFGRAFEVAWGFVGSPNLNRPGALSIERLSSLILWFVFAGLAVALLYARTRFGLRPVLFAVLASVLIVGDLFRAGIGYNPGIPDSHAQQPTTPAIRYLQKQRPARFVALEPYVGVNGLPPNVNLRYGLYDARGYDFPVTARFGALWTRYVAPATPLLPLNTPAVPFLNLELKPSALRVLSLFGVRDILEQKGQPRIQKPGLHVVYDGSDGVIYQNDNALPRTWLVTNQEVIPSDAGVLTKIGSASFNPRQVVITQHRLRGLSEGRPSGRSPGTAHITQYGAERVTIEAHATRRAELVLSDTSYPGWQVSIDGRPASLDRVDYVFRGVSIPPGTHRIVMTYNPSSYRTGSLVSLFAALILLAAAIIGLRLRRKTPARRTPEGPAIAADKTAAPVGDDRQGRPAVPARSPPTL